MDRDQLANALYGEADRFEFEFPMDRDAPPLPRATSRRSRGLATGLIALGGFVSAALLLAAG